MPSRKKRPSRPPTPTYLNTTLSYDAKVILVVLLLLLAYPIGVALMWFWVRNWPLWLKILITSPIALLVTLMVLGFFFFATIGHDRYERRAHYMYYYTPSQNSTPSAPGNTY